MRFLTSAILAAAMLSLSSAGAPARPGEKASDKPGDKAPKAAKSAAPIAPKQGVKTPGIQIPFSLVTTEASLPAPGKPSWMFFLPDSPAGGGRAGGGGTGRTGSGGGGRGGGGQGAGAGTGPAPAAAAGTLLIPAADKLDRVETKTNKPGEPVAGLKQPCGGIVSAFGSLWVPTCGDGALQRIDPKTWKITATIASGAAAVRGSIAAGSDSVWLLTDGKETLARIDPDQNAVVGEIRLPAGCNSLSFAETALWLACPEQNKVLKINPATNLVDKRIEVSGRPLSIASGEGSIWVLCGKDGKIDRIDPKTDKVSKSIELSVPNAEGAMAFGEGFLWVTMNGFPVTRIDPAGESVAQQFWGEGGGGIAVGSGAIWLSNLAAGTVTRIDPKLILATLSE